MWLVQIIFIFRVHILRKTVNPFLLQILHCKWIWSCSQEVSTEQCPKCYMLAGLEFCRSHRCYLHVGFWKLHLWKLLINQLFLQIHIILPLKLQFSWLWFQNYSTVLASTSKVFMTSNSFCLVVRVLLNTLAQGHHGDCVEKTEMDNTASVLFPFQDYFFV